MVKQATRVELNPEQKGRLDDAPDRCKGILLRTYQGKAPPRVAIKAFCLQCTGYVRADVADCTALGCPLHPYRPYRSGDEGEE